MNDLILSINDVAVLNTATIAEIANLDKAIKELKDKQDALKSALLTEMRAKNIRKIENDVLSISYIFPTDREDFDKEAFRKDNPALYDSYVKMTPVKDSIRIKVK